MIWKTDKFRLSRTCKVFVFKREAVVYELSLRRIVSTFWKLLGPTQNTRKVSGRVLLFPYAMTVSFMFTCKLIFQQRHFSPYRSLGMSRCLRCSSLADVHHGIWNTQHSKGSIKTCLWFSFCSMCVCICPSPWQYDAEDGQIQDFSKIYSLLLLSEKLLWVNFRCDLLSPHFEHG